MAPPPSPRVLVEEAVPSGVSPAKPEIQPSAAAHSREEIVAALGSSFAAGIIAETAKFDINAKLCESNVGKERAALLEIQNQPGIEYDLVDAVTVALQCLECIPTSLDACWDLPALIRLLGGTPPSLTLGGMAPLKDAERTKLRTTFLRKFSRFIDAAVACEDEGMPPLLREDAESLGDRIEAMVPPDDNLREAAHELGGCLECGLHAMKFCDRAWDAEKRARKNPNGRQRMTPKAGQPGKTGPK